MLTIQACDADEDGWMVGLRFDDGAEHRVVVMDPFGTADDAELSWQRPLTQGVERISLSCASNQSFSPTRTQRSRL